MNHLVPESDPAVISRYRVDQRREVDSILRVLAGCDALIAVFDSPHSHEPRALTTLKSFDAAHLRLEMPPAERAAPSGTVVLVALLNEVKVQMVARVRRLAAAATPPVLVLDRPDHLFRIQRRATYRVRPPSGVVAHVYVPAPKGRVRCAVLDISVDGVALAAPAGLEGVSRGAQLRGCDLHLLEGAPIRCDLDVVRAVQRLDGLHLGCRLQHENKEDERRLQRLIMEIEIQRRCRM